MKILELSEINKFDDGTDFLVEVILSKKEQQKLGEKYPRWVDEYDTATAHVWVVNDCIDGLSLSVIDSRGGFENDVAYDGILSHKAVNQIATYVGFVVQQEKMNDLENIQNDMER